MNSGNPSTSPAPCTRSGLRRESTNAGIVTRGSRLPRMRHTLPSLHGGILHFTELPQPAGHVYFTSCCDRRKDAIPLWQANRKAWPIRPKSPTSVIPAQSLPPRRRGRESIPGKVRHHYPGSSLSRGPLRSGGESNLFRLREKQRRSPEGTTLWQGLGAPPPVSKEGVWTWNTYLLRHPQGASFLWGSLSASG